ncbi:MAG TPA: glycosyltransferase [Acidocella sp.]|nr:glycosyltransferase [Acidocella sp.]
MTQPVTILLSTFNGEKYLAEQLASIVAQRFANWQILWRDDGSSDNTVVLMRSFADQIGHDRVVEHSDSGHHYGAAPSFLCLLRAAAHNPIIAFADQDDVWLPDKLTKAVRQIKAAGEVPALYCARQFLVDQHLRGHRLSALHVDKGFPACLVQNIANGNTLVMNKAAASMVAAVPAPQATVHDWWSYIVVPPVVDG